jgi:phosphoglycerol transferase MdoB-like AlkP superfamily enzyme
MFDRAIEELDQLPKDKPFLAILQTLSNHTPYSLPDPLPMDPVMIDGEVSERLTAMRYSDYALGEFFKQVSSKEYFDDTLFVILGDHGFGVQEQLTSVDLLRFHVPLLMIGPGVIEKFGHQNAVVSSQVDVVPTVMSLLGKPYEHQCWGRDVLHLSADDHGIAAIKPSGNDPTVALISDDNILVRDPGGSLGLYRYRFDTRSQERLVIQSGDNDKQDYLWRLLSAYIESALIGLRDNTTDS